MSPPHSALTHIDPNESPGKPVYGRLVKDFEIEQFEAIHLSYDARFGSPAAFVDPPDGYNFAQLVWYGASGTDNCNYIWSLRPGGVVRLHTDGAGTPPEREFKLHDVRSWEHLDISFSSTSGMVRVRVSLDGQPVQDEPMTGCPAGGHASFSLGAYYTTRVYDVRFDNVVFDG